MKKRLAAAAALLLAAAVLCGCGSVFDKEYVQIEDYVSAVQENDQSGERVTVFCEIEDWKLGTDSA